MGNCVQGLSEEAKDQKAIVVVTYNGEVLEFRGSTKAKNVISGAYSCYSVVHRSRPFSPLHSSAKLKPGEIYHLVPDMAKVMSQKIVSHEEESCGKSSQKVKIVVTREELELLLGSQDILGLGFEEGSPKWRPSLSSIAEVKDF